MFQLSPVVSAPFRYRTTILNSLIGPRTHLASPLLSSPLFLFDPQPVLLLSRFGRSIVLFVPLSDNDSHSTIVRSSIYTLAVASPGPHLDLLVFGPGTPLFVLVTSANSWSLGQSLAVLVCACHRSTPPFSRSFKSSSRVASSLSSASLGQDLPWTRLPPQTPSTPRAAVFSSPVLNHFKPPANLFVPYSRLRAFKQKVYSPLPLHASSLPQPARHPQVSHRCCARTPPLNDRLHLSW